MTLQWMMTSTLSLTKIQQLPKMKIAVMPIESLKIWIKTFSRHLWLNNVMKKMKKWNKIHLQQSIAIKATTMLFRWPQASKLKMKKMTTPLSKMNKHQIMNWMSKTKLERFNNLNKLKKLNSQKKLKLHQFRLLQKVKKLKRRLRQRKEKKARNQLLKNLRENNQSRRLNLKLKKRLRKLSKSLQLMLMRQMKLLKSLKPSRIRLHLMKKWLMRIN